MRNILELDKNPLLTSYWFYANLVASVSNVDKNNYFAANNYNNIFCYKTPDIPFLYFTSEVAKPMMNMYFDCPYLDFQKINKDYFFNTSKMSLIDFIRHSINSGYFVQIMIDRFFIKEYGFMYHSNHEIMIYGYDDESNKIHFCDNTLTGAYRTDLTCDYPAFTEAYEKAVFHLHHNGDVHPIAEHVYLSKPRENSMYCLDIDEIRRSLNQYLHLSLLWGAKAKEENEIVWGIKVYEIFKSYLQYISEFPDDNFVKDIRSFCVLWDHKKSVLATLEVLCANDLLDAHYVESYRQIGQTVLVFRNKIQKLYVDNNKKRIQTLIDSVNGIAENEYSVLSAAVGQL